MKALCIVFITLFLTNLDGSKLTGRIIGGKNATIEEFPHQVLIYSRNTRLCSGTIISPSHILTTGRCIYGIAPHDLRIHVGSAIDGNGKQYKVHKYLRHDNQGHERSEYYDYDLSLIFLSKKLSFSKKINKISLPEASEYLLPNTSAVVTGWGENQVTPGFPSKVLQKASVQVLDDSLCQKVLPGEFISSRMLCAGIPGVGITRRDVGGCLIVDDKLHGLMSWTSGYNGDDYIAIFAKVSALRDWIKVKTGI